MKIHHLNCGILQAPGGPPAACHCLLLESDSRLVLVDTGIGLEDIREPLRRVGQAAIDAAGFQFHEHLTAAHQIPAMGWSLQQVTDILLTHGDSDHAGGLADFPAARVHVSEEEYAPINSGHERYSAAQFEHQPRWVRHSESPQRWFGLEARPVPLFSQAQVYLVPLFGHTAGHCGVALQVGDGWLVHVGDAYYLRAELDDDRHPISQLTALRALDDGRRRESLEKVRRLAQEQRVTVMGYHDFSEFPEGA